jgi:cardiolipin synthase
MLRPPMPLPLQILFWCLAIFAALVASGHAIIYKREARSAMLWVLVVWLLPILGPVLYLLLGVNRLRTEAVALRRGMIRHRTTADAIPCDSEGAFLPRESIHLHPLAQLGCRVTDRQLLPGNTIHPLIDGSKAYPAMLAAIDNANESIALSTYIFDAAGIGEKFIDALDRAQQRGVQVRVLIDAMGAKYCRPSIVKTLRARNIPTALFNQPWRAPWLSTFNLRNHRKILVTDGKLGFIGGFNIKREYWTDPTMGPPGSSLASSSDAPPNLYRDLHFRLEGPVVAHLSEVFVDDWQFTTREDLPGPKWFPSLTPIPNGAPARGIEAGPDESYDRLRWVIIGAINAARKNIRIATPYYLPDSAIISALNAAALRGVQVDILLPEKSNLFYINWATFGQLWQTLERGCRVFVNPGPFDHSKLFIIDNTWSLIGSANWDARSLRLNFEFCVEAYDPGLAFQLDQIFDTRLTNARQLTLEQIDARPLPIKLRDAFFRLFTPYL